MSVSAVELATLMRPVVGRLERSLQRMLKAELAIPTRNIPRIELSEDGSGRQWVETEVDFWRLRLDAMSAVENSRDLFVAEAAIARRLDLEPDTQSGGTRPWTPQGHVVDVFLEEYLRCAYGDEGHLHGAQALRNLRDPSETALTAQAERLERFLSCSRFIGRLVVPLGGVRLPADTLHLEPGVSIVPFSPAWRDELWRIAGWGSAATQPLKAQDFFDVSHAITVEIHGAHLGGWDWAAGQATAERVRLALLLGGAASVRAGLTWLRLDEEFAPYLSRLGAGSGLVRQTSAPDVTPLTRLPRNQAAQLPDIYRHLATVRESGRLALALRRLRLSSERASPEDRLIDTWVGLEALFVPDETSELSFRATLRIARFVGRDADDRRKLFDGLRRAYKWRSRLLHGVGDTRAKAKNLGTLPEAVEISEHALRAALRRWLVAPPSPDLHEIDESFLA